jgi:hypothetical protein
LHDEIGGNRPGRSEQIVHRTGRRMIEARIVDRPRCQSQGGSCRRAGQAEAHDALQKPESVLECSQELWMLSSACDFAAFASLPIRLILPLSKSAKKESETFSG